MGIALISLASPYPLERVSDHIISGQAVVGNVMPEVTVLRGETTLITWDTTSLIVET